ncbi:tetratricopeptide repeat protein [Desulfovibrio sp. UCD-KL4C]|uniref:tetratricopeptide repeat protein n=1 Tax=Desulfovibrio sp. UCD-KL4C TaxID=2578120 RepID=UPI0025BFC0BF|nr:tetratricopeptide repeat protein [Desulfovibrio sp. UCD-KL4C]
MRKLIILWVLVAVIFSVFTGCEQRREDFYNKAVEYYKQKKFTESRLELKNAIAIDPECGSCRLLFGKLALEEGNFQSAFANFKYAVEFDPSLIEAKVELSKLYLLAKDYDNASDMARNVLNVDSSNVKARLVLSSVLSERKKYDEAENLLTAALNEDPRNADIYLALSRLYYRQNSLDKAEAVLIKGISQIPSSTALLMNISALYRDRKEPQKAEKFVEKMLKSGNEEPRFILFAAQYYSSISMTKRAEELMSVLVSKYPEKDNYRVLYAQLLSASKKYDLAIATLKDGLHLNNASLPLRSALSSIYLNKGNQNEAVSVLEDGAAIDPEGGDNVVYRKKLATLYLNMNEVGKALEQLNLVVNRNPKDGEAHYLRGQIYLLEGEGREAVSEFRQVLRDNPQSAPAHVLLAKAHLANDEVGIAIENLKDAISLDAGYAPARETLINAYLDRKDWQQAILELQRLKEKRPDDINILAAIGDVYTMKGDYNLAKRTFTNIVTRFPKSSIGFLKSAELAIKEGKKNLAEQYYNDALNITPDSLVAIQGKIDILVDQNKYTAAIKFCNKMLKQYPDNARLYEMLGGVHSRRGHFAKAEESYFKAIEFAPNWLVSYMRIGDIYAAQHEIKKGIIKFENVVKKDETNPAPLFIIGLLYEKENNYKKAKDTYSRLLVKFPEFKLAANNLAYLLAEHFSDNAADIAQALKFAKIAASSQNPEALDTLGYVLYLKGDYEESLHVLNTALQIAPDFSAAVYHKALVFSRNGKKDEAKKMLTNLLKTQDNFPEKQQVKSLLVRL